MPTPNVNNPPFADLHIAAKEIFSAALRAVDAGAAVHRGVMFTDECLSVVGHKYNLREYAGGIFAVAMGKAAGAMAKALNETLEGKLTRGVISAPLLDENLSARWRQFAGSHPLPNAESLAAGRAAIELLEHVAQTSATGRRALIIFLVSGGGSAMLELPRAENVTLEDLQAANKILVGCGAAIAEINAVRRAWSQIKGGGLSRAAGASAQVSLIISDTNAGDEANVASGPTFTSNIAENVNEIITRYELATRLPKPILDALKNERQASDSAIQNGSPWYTLLDNASALKGAARAAERLGFIVETTNDLIETPIDEGCAKLVARLWKMRRDATRDGNKNGVCLISGGEFACPLMGEGTGGRNSEAALRCAFEFDARTQNDLPSPQFVALHAGTDGIDGNSPAAGAIADETTLARAAAFGLDARDYLKRSDSYTFFARLDDAIITGATGTNVRDVRILLAR